jgi:hypothetical protein
MCLRRLRAETGFFEGFVVGARFRNERKCSSIWRPLHLCRGQSYPKKTRRLSEPLIVAAAAPTNAIGSLLVSRSRRIA